MWRKTRDRLCGLFAALGLLGTGVALAQDSPAMAALIEIEGGIGPATTGDVDKALASATERGARLVILRLDTPRRPGERDARHRQARAQLAAAGGLLRRTLGRACRQWLLALYAFQLLPVTSPASPAARPRCWAWLPLPMDLITPLLKKLNKE